MIDPATWQEGNEHPDRSLLLLFVEDDLDRSGRVALTEHLKHCWVCQAELERLNRGICHFVEHWERSKERPLPQPLRTASLQRHDSRS